MNLSAKTPYADQYSKGQERCTYNRYGEVTRVYIPISHKTLNLYKEISGSDQYTLQSKFTQLVASWDAKYDAYLRKQGIENGQAIAEEMEAENEQKVHELGTILAQTLTVNDEVDWEAIKVEPNLPERPIPPTLPKEPVRKDVRLRDPSIHMGFFARITGKKRRTHEKAIADFERELSMAEHSYENEMARHRARVDEWNAEYERQMSQYQRAVEAQLTEVETHNLKIDDLREAWRNGNPEAVIEHACLVLDASVYPAWLNTSYQVQYDASEKLIKLQFLLPSPEVVNIPKAVSFVKTTGELRPTDRPKKECQEYYDKLCYQIALRTVHELFEADTAQNISHILFNGVVDGIDPATGREVSTTIMSAIFEKEKFVEVNLRRVDPKACFKSFNGVSATSLAGLAPVSPVMVFDTSDRRFIDAKSVIDDENVRSNLASMSWEDFEHLVREVFAKEFSSRGGEVKVTQSSFDGGVDAVAFDPDPISGGKIVIQAKRYTKTVGVSAVRDLYGTTLNEGASKGILVTTADYGPDAYKFAADKPISLLNGANLLFLLEKHGINARIDLAAARQELGLR